MSNKTATKKSDPGTKIPVPIIVSILGLIGAIIGLIGVLLSQEIIVDRLLSRTTISIPAARDYSGVSSGPTLHQFDGTSTVVAFGDTTASNSVRAFLGFLLAGYP